MAIHPLICRPNGKLTTTYKTLDELVTFRNQDVAHAGLLPADDSHALYLKMRPRMDALVEACAWLGRLQLVRPREIADGTVALADLLRGTTPMQARVVDIPLHEEDLGHVSSRSLLLCDDTAYLPLFPFAVHHDGQGALFLNRLSWISRTSVDIKGLGFVGYHSYRLHHSSREDDPETVEMRDTARRLGAFDSAPPSGLRSMLWEAPDLEMVAERQSLLDGFIGREGFVQGLLEYIQQRSGGETVIITGPPGQGKSAVCARLASELESRGVGCLLYFGRIGRSPVEALRYLLWEAGEVGGHPVSFNDLDGDEDTLCQRWLRLLGQVREWRGPLVAIVDGLDEIVGDLDDDEALRFLPERVPAGVTLIISLRADQRLLAQVEARLRPSRHFGLPGLSPHEVGDDSLFDATRGNPLLLRLLRRGAEGSQQLQGLLASLYKKAVTPRRRDFEIDPGLLCQQTLHYLSVAREPLSIDVIHALVCCDPAFAVERLKCDDAGVRPPQDARPAMPAFNRDRVWREVQGMTSLLDVREERLRPFHPSLTEFVRRELGPSGEYRIHKLLEGWMATSPRLQPAYRLRHHAAHQLAMRDLALTLGTDAAPLEQSLTELLSDPLLLSERLQCQPLSEVLNDYRGHDLAPHWRDFLETRGRSISLDPGRFYAELASLPTTDPLHGAADRLPPPARPYFRLLASRAGATLLQRTVNLHGSALSALAVSSGRVASAGESGRVYVWNLQGPAQTRVLGMRGDVEVSALCFTGDRLLIGRQDGTLVLWDGGDAAREGGRPSEDPLCFLTLLDPTTVYCVDARGRVIIWSLTDSGMLAVLHEDGTQKQQDLRLVRKDDVCRVVTRSVKVWLPCGPLSVVVSQQPWTARGGCLLESGQVRVDEESPITALVSDGTVVATGHADGVVVVLEGDRMRRFHAHAGAVRALAVAGRSLLSGGVDRKVRVWDLDASAHAADDVVEALRTAFEDIVADMTTTVDRMLLDSVPDLTRESSTPDLEVLVSLAIDGGTVEAHRDGTVVTREEDGAERARFETECALSRSTTALSPDRRTLATAGAAGTILLWDMDFDERLGCLGGHDETLTCLAFLADGILVSGGADGTVRAWNTVARREMARLDLDFGVTRCAAGSLGRVAFADDHGGLYIARLDGPWPALAQADEAAESPDEHQAALVLSRRRRHRRRVERVLLDPWQAQIVAQMRSGPWFLQGGPGSGKTLILVRAGLDKVRDGFTGELLFVCFNLALTRYVSGLFERNLSPEQARRVTVLPFYGVCERLLGEAVDHARGSNEYFDAVVERAAKLATPICDALLVDEGQDLDAAKYRLLFSLVRSDDIKIASDPGQNIFGAPAVDLGAMLGVDSAERTLELHAPHRSSDPILRVACELGGRPLPSDAAPSSTTTRWHPDLRNVREDRVVKDLSVAVRALVHEQGISPAEIAVLYTSRLRKADEANGRHYPSFCQPLIEALRAADIAVNFFSEKVAHKLNLSIEEASVKMGSVYAVKGLDFQAVFVIDMKSHFLTELPDEKREAEAARLRDQLYEAATRARELLYVWRLV